MIISKKHNFIYIAVSKTGSTSIHKAFSNLDDETLFIEKENEDNKDRVNKFIYKHIKATDLKKQIENYDEHFKFSFVRNPYDRAVSWVYYYYRNRKINLDEHSFKELIFKFPDWIWTGQHEFLFEDNKNSMNFVGKVENFQQDFNIICDKIGIPKQELPHKNKTKHKHYTEYYDKETKQIVAEKYRKDIEYFGYEFGE